ncbi:hypothetical protein [Aeromonas sp. QDB68]|uniref:hypothetical protein n=1 Tax=Aeromonas sp. QDB68 TaxID=2989823 RepID=UPI0022E16697|nr:hypothetical protein [Aeromonas sp. QDB68]
MSQPTPTTMSYDVLIQLEQEDSSKSFSANELIQRRHYDSIRSEIIAHLRKLAVPNPCTQGDEPYGNGWTYFIDGSRGAGKSTFLSSAEAALKNDADLKTQMAFIAVIDPSRIEQSEIILLVILQQLSKQVNDALKGLRQTHNEPLREEWRRVFKGVAGGLSLFSKEYHPLDDLDPELFLEWGLERTSDSTSLRSKLHHLFETACRILGVKGLLFGFDDADTGTAHAIKLLECIRKYLDTPRVMVLVTGDMELYSLLVRQHFATTVAGKPDAALDLQRSSKQGDRSGQYLRMIDHMEEQYLLKLFPIPRRIQLKPLWNINLLDNCNAKYPSWGTNTPPVEDVVKAIVQQGLRVKGNADVSVYTEFLLKQPLRSVLQVLASCAPNLAISPPDKLIIGAWSAELTRELSRSLQALALTSLYKLSIDTDGIAAKELPALTQAIFDLSLEDGDMDTAPYLRPMSGEQDIKACFAALAAEVPNFCAEQPGTALRYLLRGPGSVSLYNLAQSHPCNTSQFKSYMGIGRREDSLDWARRATAVIALPYSSNYKPRVVLPGVIGLRRGIKGRSGELMARTVIKRAVDNVTIPNLPVFALSMLTVANATSPRTYGSIFTLIGLIEKLLSAYMQGEEEARAAFDRAYPSLTISSPSWSRQGNPNEEEESDEEEQISPNVQDKKDALWIAINTWLTSVRDISNKTTPSGVFLGKVWTRLFFSLQNAADELKTRAKFDSVMEIYALCVINSFLVEEAEHHLLSVSDETKVRPRVDRTNPRTNANWFVNKLHSTQPQREDFPFTAIVATCPLLLGLLDSELDYASALKPLFPNNMDEQTIKVLLCPKALKELMQKVSVTGESRTPSKTRSRKSTGSKQETVPDDATGTKEE